MDSLSLSGSKDRATDSITSTLVSSHSPASSKASSSSSASDSDDSSDSDSDSSDDDEAEDETAARLKALLLKAKESARAKASAAAAKDELAGGDEVVLFGDEDDEEEEEGQATPGASSANEKRHIAPSLTRPLSLKAPTAAQLAAGKSAKGKGKETAVTLGQDIGGEVESVPGQDRWGRAPLPSLSKKERKARHAPTAGPKWFNMPAPVVTPELKREIQAMRLRNALDPKRFFKQGAKDNQLPEFFQVGHVLESSQRATNAREGKTRKRTFVEELLEDDKAKAYAKRKFQEEVMVKGMSGRKNKNMTKKGGRKR